MISLSGYEAVKRKKQEYDRKDRNVYHDREKKRTDEPCLFRLQYDDRDQFCRFIKRNSKEKSLCGKITDNTSY